MVKSGMPRGSLARTRTDLLLHDEGGASAVEFALVASLLFLILFGVIQFGIAYNRVQGLNSAGREGSRAASIGVPIADVVSRTKQAQSLFQASDITVDIEYSNDDGSTWTTVCSVAGTPCTTQTTSPCPAPCVAGSLIKVAARVSSAGAVGAKYAIAIPLWTNWRIPYTGVGTFRVDRTG
jgi:Flp pilus assembly protein TadG